MWVPGPVCDSALTVTLGYVPKVAFLIKLDGL
jgi:hypothetical protein